MLIALAILLLGGGGDVWLFPEDFTDKVETVIVEEKKQSEIIDLFDKMNESVATHGDRVKEIAEMVSSLNRYPEATEQDFESIIESLLEERKKLQTEVLDARLNMVLQFHQNEWEHVFSADSVFNKN